MEFLKSGKDRWNLLTFQVPELHIAEICMIWSRFKTHFYHLHAGRGFSLRRQPDAVSRWVFLVTMAPKLEQAFADLVARAGKGRHRQPRIRKTHGGPLLAARNARARPDAGTEGDAISSTPLRGDQRLRRRGPSRATITLPPATASSGTAARHRHRRLGARAAVRRPRSRPSSRPDATRWASTSSTTPIQTAWTTS